MPKTAKKIYDGLFISDLIIITIVMIAAFCLYGVPTFFTPDEGRYAEIAREMVISHNYLVPHLDGVVYFEKPPLIYWLTAFFLKLFGFNIWAARLVNPVLSLIGVIMVYWVTRLVFTNRRVALWAALISGTSILYGIVGRYLSMDAGVSFFLTATMLCFWASQKYPQHYLKSSIWLLFAFIFAGCAVMSKGLIGIVFPMMIIGIWVIVTGRWRLLGDIRLYLGLVIVAIISVPWIPLVNQQYPQFAYYYVVVQQILRYATDEQGREMSKLVYLGIFIFGFFPWYGFLPQAIKQGYIHFRQRTQYADDWFLLIWGASIFLFFAFSKSILAGYLAPTIVPFAILMARHLDRIIDRPVFSSATKASIIAGIAFFALLALASIILPFIPQFFVYFPELSALFFPAAFICLIITILSWIYLKRQNLKAIMMLFVIAMIFVLNLGYSGAQYFSQKSVKPLTTILKPLLKSHPQAVVANFGGYFYDAPFYLNRLTWIVGFEGELKHSATLANSGADETLKSTATFWKAWDSPKQVFVFMDDDKYQQYFASGEKKGYLLGHTPKRYLLTNHTLSKT
ncbi:MAG: phospholipid carrier-dependent glycosyltransferase [Francisellaceae bacterium]